MHHRFAALLAAALAMPAACATRAVAPDAVAAAEREFAADGLRRGVQQSFLAHFADDAVVLHPFATPARQWYESHPDHPGRLIWGPQYVAVAAAGDLALSSGPWRFEAEREGKPVTAHGHFFSLWRRDVHGWKVVFDHGIGHGAPAAPVEDTALVTLAAAASARPAAAPARRRALALADDALRERLARGAPDPYAPVARSDTLWLRDDALPAAAAAAPVAAPGARPACGCGPRVRLELAAGADFAYTIGGTQGARERGADVRVWRFDADRGWTLLSDLAVAAD